MTNNKGIQRNYEEISYVKCSECSRLFDKHSDKYFSLTGNICAGMGGGILGNSDWDRLGIPVYVFCKECLIMRIDGGDR